eukprot:scaffold4439_cov163-Isochrysis_galbana.AAC.2
MLPYVVVGVGLCSPPCPSSSQRFGHVDVWQVGGAAAAASLARSHVVQPYVVPREEHQRGGEEEEMARFATLVSCSVSHPASAPVARHVAA